LLMPKSMIPAQKSKKKAAAPDREA